MKFPLSAAVAGVVIDWILMPSHKNNVFLFCKRGTKGELPYAKQPTQEEAEAGADEGGMSSWVGNMLRASLPAEDHALIHGVINFLRKSWASSSTLPEDEAAVKMMHGLEMHKATYVVPLRAGGGAGGDDDDDDE